MADEQFSKKQYVTQVSFSPKKDASPKLNSPTGKGGTFSSFINFGGDAKNQQIMTQISSIYNKRSRSIQNPNSSTANGNSSMMNDQ